MKNNHYNTKIHSVKLVILMTVLNSVCHVADGFSTGAPGNDARACNDMTPGKIVLFGRGVRLYYWTEGAGNTKADVSLFFRQFLPKT